MAENPFDKASRYAAKIDPSGFLRWVLDLPPDAFAFRSWLDTRGLPFPGDPDRVSDTVVRLDDPAAGGQPWAIAIEFQTEPDALMFGRLLEYLGQLWRTTKPDAEKGSRFHVGAVVVNLSGTGLASRDMRWAGLATKVQVVERNLASESADELLGAIERGEHSRALLPWIPLMTGADEAGMIERWKRAGEAEPDDRQRSSLAGLAKVFAEAAGRKELWVKQLEGWNMKVSTVVEEWRLEGEVRGLVAGVLGVLEAKFGGVPPELADAIRPTTDAAQLRSWLIAASRAGDLAEFRSSAGV